MTKPQAPGRSLAQNLLLVAFSLGVVLAAGEVAVRFYAEYLIDDQIDRLGIHVGAVEAETWRPWRDDGTGHFHVRSSNRVRVYENRPDAHLIVKRGNRDVLIETNSDGFRDGEFSRTKSDDVFRIAAVGDSVTIGLFFEQNELYSELAEAQLNSPTEPATGPCRYEIYNMGTTGYNAEQEVELIRTRVADFAPDLVLLSYVFNDDQIGQDAGLWAHFSRSPLRSWDFVKLRWLELVESRRKTTLTERSFATLADWVEERGIPVLVLVFPLFDSAGEEYRHRDLHEEIEGLTTRFGFRRLDLLDAFAEHTALDKNDGDIIHPTAEGHRIAARGIVKFVRDSELTCAEFRP
jgi:hypothetical protein